MFKLSRTIDNQWKIHWTLPNLLIYFQYKMMLYFMQKHRTCQRNSPSIKCFPNSTVALYQSNVHFNRLSESNASH